MLPRFFWGVVLAICLLTIASVLLIGVKPNTPIGCCRKTILRWFYKMFTIVFFLTVNFSLISWEEVSLEDVNHYAEFLGDRKT